ncbi:MAG: hypothetical protein U0Q16_18885 [Bryobacteraceae bacterium]
MEDSIKIAAFWSWFSDHRSALAELSDPEESLWDLALGRLKEIDAHLWFELSASANPVREFIITAEGHTPAFHTVELLVEQAPSIAGWVFVALKPPMGFSFVTSYEGMPFDPREMWFLPLESESRPHDLGIRVGIAEFDSLDQRQACNAVLVILDTGLGERSAALDICHVEVAELPADPEPAGYIELCELADYIEWRKTKLGPSP